MAHTYASLLYHCVFSTKERRNLIPDAAQDELWAYMGGVARGADMKTLAVGGTANHCHILLSLSTTQSVADAVKRIKANSSRWLSQLSSGVAPFAWQGGYGAFSIGVSQVDATKAYIARQTSHHRTKTFEEEFQAILDTHRIDHDRRYVWG